MGKADAMKLPPKVTKTRPGLHPGEVEVIRRVVGVWFKRLGWIVTYPGQNGAPVRIEAWPAHPLPNRVKVVNTAEAGIKHLEGLADG